MSKKDMGKTEGLPIVVGRPKKQKKTHTQAPRTGITNYEVKRETAPSGE